MTMNKIGRSLLALLLAAVLLAGISALADEAEPVDTTRQCSITLHLFKDAAEDDAAASGEMSYAEKQDDAAYAELDDAVITAAVYKVAATEDVTGEVNGQAVTYDGFTFTLTEDFASLEIKSDMSAEDVDALAASAAECAAKAKPVTTVERAAGEDDIAVKDLDSGLYLVLLSGEDQAVGTVQTKSFTFTYKPVLVSLPTRDSEEIGEASVVMTSDSGAWSYDAEVNLVNKETYEARTNRVQITKTYEVGDDPDMAEQVRTCVFEISATLYGEVVYNDVVTLAFAPNELEQTYEIPVDLPVGAKVAAREIYPGAGYQETHKTDYWESNPIEIQPTDYDGWNNTFSFVNTPVSSIIPPSGGSVTNVYTASESEAGDGLIDWNVEQVPNLPAAAESAQ